MFQKSAKNFELSFAKTLPELESHPCNMLRGTYARISGTFLIMARDRGNSGRAGAKVCNEMCNNAAGFFSAWI